MMNDISQLRTQLRTDQEYVLGFKRSDLESIEIVPVDGPLADKIPKINLTPEAKAELLTLLHYPTVSSGDQIQAASTTFEIVAKSPVQYDSWSRKSVDQLVGSGSR